MTLHYLFLAVFGWMLVEGINLYNKIVKVYGAENPRMKLYMCIGWAVPIPIVLITVGIRYNTYITNNRRVKTIFPDCILNYEKLKTL